jgi:drug/metabolite transporter (DMT)-like permease
MDNKNKSRVMLFYVSMGLVIISIVFYQLFQKSISTTVDPIVSLILTYGIAIILSFILLIFFPPQGSVLESFKKANAASYLLGLAVVGIELGYLLVYRNGWKFSFSSAFSSSVALIILVIIGTIFFKEHISLTKITGLLFCLLGIALLSIK